MIHVPSSQILQSLIVTPWPDRPLIFRLDNVRKPSLCDQVFHDISRLQCLAKCFAAFNGQFSAFVVHISWRDGAVVRLRNGGDFGLFDIAAGGEMSAVNLG